MGTWRESGTQEDSDTVLSNTKQSISKAQKRLTKQVLSSSIGATVLMFVITPGVGIAVGSLASVIFFAKYLIRLNKIKDRSNDGVNEVVKRAAERSDTGMASEHPIDY